MSKLKKIRLEILPVRGIAYTLINEMAEMLVNNVLEDSPEFRYKYIQLHIHLEKKQTNPTDYLKKCKIQHSIISDFIKQNLCESFNNLSRI